jgi:hypothetical protein
MNGLVPIRTPVVPALVAAAGERAGMRFLEFFAANIRNPHTRQAYARAAATHEEIKDFADRHFLQVYYGVHPDAAELL